MNGITGTFLDEITFDIPSANWGAEERAADFDAMQAIGIDTVILIRSGFKDRMTFEFSHFMSPNSMWPSTRNLYRRYQEWTNETPRSRLRELG